MSDKYYLTESNGRKYVMAKDQPSALSADQIVTLLNHYEELYQKSMEMSDFVERFIKERNSVDE